MAALIPPSQSFSLLWLARDASRCHTGAHTHILLAPLAFAWQLPQLYPAPVRDLRACAGVGAGAGRPAATPAAGTVLARARPGS